MKLLIGFILSVLSCEQIPPLKFVSGTILPQVGGAAGMGKTEQYQVFFISQNPSLRLDSVFTYQAASEIYDVQQFGDTLCIKYSLNYPGAANPHPPKGKSDNLKENDLLFVGRYNQNPFQILINKNKLITQNKQHYK